MSLREMARKEGVAPSVKRTISSWLDEHPSVADEILEMRLEGFSWVSLIKLLKKEYSDFPSTHSNTLRLAMVDR